MNFTLCVLLVYNDNGSVQTLYITRFHKYQHFIISSTLYFSDVNECQSDIDSCSHSCYNNDGSYTCGCPVGYFLSTDGYKCEGTCI